MKIEHVALNVKDPVAAAKWYTEHFRMRIARNFGPPTYGHFLADEKNHTVLEFYNNPKAPVPDYFAMNALVLHIAFAVESIQDIRDSLLRHDATLDADITISENGDELAMVRDPWGVPLQLVKRAKPIL